MACKKCNRTPCGCQDNALTTIPIDYTCNIPQVCSEFTYTGCIIYNGPEIITLGLIPGMTLNDVLQKIDIAIADGGYQCTTLDNSCNSVILKILAVTSTTIKIGWNLITSASGYIFNYGVYPGLTTPVFLLPTADSYLLTGLLPDTEYIIYVDADCSPGGCTSAQIIVKTNP